MSTPAAYFESMYASSEDPWSLGERWYEQRKYALTVAALPRARYRSGFEPGCSVGVLTALLAPRCERLLAVDRVQAAVAAARERLRDQPHVRVELLDVGAGWPAGTFDLVVLSELGYYQDEAGCRRLLDAAVGSLEPGGDLVAVHWRAPVAEHALSGDAVHAILATLAGLSRMVRHDEADFLLEVYTRTPPGHRARTVAEAEGLVGADAAS